MVGSVCRRCGMCCRKGGPALHDQDMPLIHEGVITYAHMCTLRQGELVHDEARGETIPLEREVVKLRGSSPRSWACLFFSDSPDEKGCDIYGHRPAECSALSCEDTSALVAMYDKKRLTRLDILQEMPDLAALVCAHEYACSYATLPQVDTVLHKDVAAGEKLLDAVRLDFAFRQAARERVVVPDEQMLFLFGRPMFETLGSMYGVRILRENNALCLVLLDSTY